MRRVTNTNLLFWVNFFTQSLTEHFLQGNVPLMHLLNEKPLFISWRRSAFNEVNDWALRQSTNSILPGGCVNIRKGAAKMVENLKNHLDKETIKLGKLTTKQGCEYLYKLNKSVVS